MSRKHSGQVNLPLEQPHLVLPSTTTNCSDHQQHSWSRYCWCIGVRDRACWPLAENSNICRPYITALFVSSHLKGFFSAICFHSQLFRYHISRCCPDLSVSQALRSCVPIWGCLTGDPRLSCAPHSRVLRASWPPSLSRSAGYYHYLNSNHYDLWSWHA